MHTIARAVSMVGMTLLASASVLLAHAEQGIRNIPSSKQAWKWNKEPLFTKLDMLLKQGEFIKFYKAAKVAMDKRESLTADGTLSGDDLEKQLLLDRYVASAPLVEFKVDEAVHEEVFLGSDIRLKERLMDDLYSVSKANLEQNRPPSQKKETARLCSIYVATVVRMLRQAYRPNMKEENRVFLKNQETALQKEFTDKWGLFLQEEEEREKNWKQPEKGQEQVKDPEREKKKSL